MSNVWTGQVQDICKVVSESPVALCRAILGGTLTFDPHNISRLGIGSQVHARKGTTEATLEVRCVGVAAADLALWFPTTRGVQLASFPDFYVQADDGTNSYKVLLSDCQPASITIEQGNGEDAEVEVNLSLKAATVDPADSGVTPAYNSLKGHTLNDTVVTIGTDELGVMSWSLANDLGLKIWNPRNTKTTKTLPFGWIITQQAPRFQAVCSDFGRASDILDDDYTPENIVIALANGTTAQNIDITCSSFIPGPWSADFPPEDIVGHAHEWIPGSGNVHGRVVFEAGAS